MNVRQVRDLEDVRAMEEVNRRAWRDAYDGIFPHDVLERLTAEPSPSELRHRFDRLSAWTGEALVAESGGEVVGYAVVRWGDVESYVPDGDAWLKELYVDPTLWGEGVGTALVEHAAAATPPETAGLVASMLAGNEVGERFYEAKGFEEIDAWEDEIAGERYPTVVYRLEL